MERMHHQPPNIPSKVKFVDARESHNEKKQKIAANKLLQGQRSVSDDQILDKIIQISAQDSQRDVQVGEIPIWRDKESPKEGEPLADDFLSKNPALVEELKARIRSGLEEETKEKDYMDQEGAQSWGQWWKDPHTQDNIGKIFGWKYTLPLKAS